MASRTDRVEVNFKQLVEEFLETWKRAQAVDAGFSIDDFVSWVASLEKKVEFDTREIGYALTELVKEGKLVVFTPDIKQVLFASCV